MWECCSSPGKRRWIALNTRKEEIMDFRDRDRWDKTTTLNSELGLEWNSLDQYVFMNYSFPNNFLNQIHNLWQELTFIYTLDPF